MSMNQKNQKILIVDDERELTERLSEGLEAHGYSVRTCGDGLSALEILDRHPADLVLLDLGLPKLDGHQVLRRLQAQPGGCVVPVIVITAQEEVERLNETLREGAVSFYPKPFQFDRLLNLIRVFLTPSPS